MLPSLSPSLDRNECLRGRQIAVRKDTQTKTTRHVGYEHPRPDESRYWQADASFFISVHVSSLLLAVRILFRHEWSVYVTHGTVAKTTKSVRAPTTS